MSIHTTTINYPVHICGTRGRVIGVRTQKRTLRQTSYELVLKGCTSQAKASLGRVKKHTSISKVIDGDPPKTIIITATTGRLKLRLAYSSPYYHVYIWYNNIILTLDLPQVRVVS